MRRVKRLVALAVSALTAASIVTAAPAAVAATEPIAWGPCTDPTLVAAGGECGYLSVPLDHDHPDGAKIQLAVGRIKHKVPDSQYQGVMITLPGGPGGSGLYLGARGAKLPNAAGDAYDWIGFDPRGVGSSKPALSCDPNYMDYNRPNYLPVTPQLEQTWLQRSKSYADACAQKNDNTLLQHMKTTDSVKDIDSIRAALGVRQASFYGFSYGTYLGQVYGTLFPQAVRRMVLDSTVDPRDVFYQSNLNQDVAFDRNIRIWFDWVAKYDSVYHLGATGAAVQRVFDEQLAKLSFQPAGGVIGPDEWLDVFLQAAYYQLRWPSLGDAFAKFVNQGDWQTMKTLFETYGGRGDDNGFAVYLAVQCTDVQWPTNWNQWRADNWRTFLRAPYFTWMNAWYNAPCVYWPAKAGKPVDVDGRGVQSVLMIDETLDAPTPYEGSLEVRKRFPGAVLVAEPGGTSHAITPRGNACVDDKISDYLLTGALPARKPGNRADALCDPLPQPVPATS